MCGKILFEHRDLHPESQSLERDWDLALRPATEKKKSLERDSVSQKRLGPDTGTGHLEGKKSLERDERLPHEFTNE